MLEVISFCCDLIGWLWKPQEERWAWQVEVWLVPNDFAVYSVEEREEEREEDEGRMRWRESPQ